MHLSLCTISFRHHLTSMEEIASWAQQHHFDGIELWGIHAMNLADQPQLNARWLDDYALSVSMISDYLPLQGSLQQAYQKVDNLCQLAHRWGSRKLRTFAGQKASIDVGTAERQRWTEQLHLLAERCRQHGIRLLVETHPQTLADTTASTLRLLKEVDHASLAVNFDVLHLWEAGENLRQSLAKLLPFVEHFHLKNILSRQQLAVFAPSNVYSPAGNHHGMVGLFEGAVDYRAFLQNLPETVVAEASLEWFGPSVHSVLQNDSQQLQQFFKQQRLAS